MFTALQCELANLRHLLFIEPEAQICSYSLGRDSLANVFWWSTIGIELAMLGATCMPALADQSPGLGIRYHCFADRLPMSTAAWDACLLELIARPSFDHSFVLQACYDFYFSIGYGFIDLSSIDSVQLLAMFLLGTSIQEPQPSLWNPPSPTVLQESLSRLLAGLEA